ncbi:MAG: NAD(P)/FAD-dependent oxidoreductase [Pseudobdellovibrio sp.]
MKIAVIGSGISGLASALILNEKHEVHLFESDERLGGHAHTNQITIEDREFGVDTGFLVYNDLTYPHLKSLFKYLDVETVASDMSLSLNIVDQKIEWAGDSLNTVFAQRKNLFNPKFYKMLFDILKFHKEAEALRLESIRQKWTIGELISHKSYSRELLEWYILPMVAAIWSTPEKGMMDFPAETFLTFFLNHKLLQVNDRPVWRTVKNGSINYVNKIAAKLKHIHLSEPITEVLYDDKSLQVQLQSIKGKYMFDKVIFATHAPITRKIYKNPSTEQFNMLKVFETIPNQAVLHNYEKLMPKNRSCWASWNVISNLNSKYDDKVSLTYYLNRLQPLPTQKHVLLTLNPAKSVDHAILTNEYHHPKFDQAAIDSQKLIDGVQGVNNVYFAGAWTRYGFHEDGILSAVKVGEKLGVHPPWTII